MRSGDLTGHLDLRVWHSDHGEAIIDLKTGQIGTAWLQVGGYLYLDMQISAAHTPTMPDTAAVYCTYHGLGLTRKQKARWKSGKRPGCIAHGAGIWHAYKGC